ncbi:hypothetical protein ACTXT7_006177 [Hymenolepis weldensis]
MQIIFDSNIKNDLFVHFTKLSPPKFPLEIHESFSFEKRFFDTLSPYELCRKLEGLFKLYDIYFSLDIPVTIELRQVTDYYNSGKLLAYFDGNARDFFMPCPTLCSTGVSPRVEFSTTTQISPSSYCPKKRIHHDKTTCIKEARLETNGCLDDPHYTQPTLNSILRSACLRQRGLKKSLTSGSGKRVLDVPLTVFALSNFAIYYYMRRAKSYTSLHDLDLKAAQERSIID